MPRGGGFRAAAHGEPQRRKHAGDFCPVGLPEKRSFMPVPVKKVRTETFSHTFRAWKLKRGMQGI